METLSLLDQTHRRFNILTGDWVLVSPHRTKRPWQGKTEKTTITEKLSHDPNCYLCKGNTRANGKVNPDYESTFVFQNDFAALIDGSKAIYENKLLLAKSESGICRVVCFSPNHALTLADLEVKEIASVVQTWQDQYSELGKMPNINHVQIFENKGAIMGCSNPHPHGQIWAQESIPQEALKKSIQQKKYWMANNKSLLADYLEQELSLKERIITENEHFVSLVPFWAVWPYESMIVPKKHLQHICQMNEVEKSAFAETIKNLTKKMDKLFDTSFPYSSGIHQSPTNKEDQSHWHWHMSFYPPLLRSATVKKFMVGYEMFGEPQRDISAETAAEQLRNL